MSSSLFHTWNIFSKRKAPLDFAKLPKIWFDAETVGNLALACIFLIVTGNWKLFRNNMCFVHSFELSSTHWVFFKTCDNQYLHWYCSLELLSLNIVYFWRKVSFCFPLQREKRVYRHSCTKNSHRIWRKRGVIIHPSGFNSKLGHFSPYLLKVP